MRFDCLRMNQNFSCTLNETVCFEGRGYCDPISLQCVCNSEYAQSSEMIDISYCSVHIVTARSVNGLAAVIWAISFFGAFVGMKIMRRREAKDEIREAKLLLIIAAFSGMYCAATTIIATSEPYGYRTLGNDVAVTIMYSLAMALGWAFVILKPIICRSGLAASVFTYLTKGRVLYTRGSPFMVLASSISALSPLLLLVPSADHQAVVSSIYLMDAIIAVLLSMFLVFALVSVRANIRAALSAANQDLTAYQRERLSQYSTRSTKIMGIFFVTIIVCASAFTVLGVNYELARRYTWIILPLVFLANALWTLKHVFNNLRLSRMVKLKEFQTSTMGGDDEELGDGGGIAQSEQQNDGGSTVAPRGTRSVSPFNSRRRQRKLKGIKRKPLELMTAVTERTAEGSVYFTHVDGLESMLEDTGASSRLETAMEVTGSEELSASIGPLRSSSRLDQLPSPIIEVPEENS